MTKVLSVLGIMIGTASVCLASPCDSETRAREAALAIESISTGGATPLTTEMYSLDSAPDTWGAILSYSGLQKTYLIKMSPDGCRVLELAAQ